MSLPRVRRPLQRSLRHLALAAVVGTALLPGVAAQAASAATCVAWTGQQPPDAGSAENSLESVTVLSPCDAWAVGFESGNGVSATLIEHWNGLAWTVVPSPSPGVGSLDLLRGVRAVSAKNIWAVGSYFDGTADRTLILHWNGTKWRTMASPNPAGSISSDLQGIRA